MHFFRSEEHLRNWDEFKENKIGGIIDLSDLMHLFSGPYFKNRRDPDYFTNMSTYALSMIPALEGLKNAGTYWRLKWFEKFGFSIALKTGLI